MLFNSLTYLLFMLVAAPLATWGPRWLRNFVFLTGSLTFYAFWRIDFLVLLLVTILIDYVAGLRIAMASSRNVRRFWLALSLLSNFGVLGFFKYTYFVLEATQSVASWLYPVELTLPFTIILPLGISFYVFQSVSYTIDVYRGVQVPVRNVFTFTTYVTFWPQLVAGPILRASELIPQLIDYERPRVGEVVYGLEEILHGLFKKVVLADSIAPLVDQGFGIPISQLGTLDVWTLAFAFGFQIYFDFAGYSSIALGSARVMGFHFPRNFDWPYLASSPRDFWKRWHISLSSWIRDYLYLPLQGVRFRGAATGGLETRAPASATPARRTLALFLTWFIMGLWHGANWTFAWWGLWHATLVWLHRVAEPRLGALPSWLRICGGWAITLPAAMLGWIFFRAQTVSDATAMLAIALDPRRIGIRAMRENDYLLTFLYLVGMLGIAGALRLGRRFRIPALVRHAAILVSNTIMIFWIFLMLRHVRQFIYFQF